MAVAWYGVKSWRMTSPVNGHVEIGTKPTTAYTYETWTVKNEAGVAQSNVIRNARPKYHSTPMVVMYDREYVAGPPEVFPTAALVRVEYPDGDALPLAAGDFDILLDTETKWNQVVALYPAFKFRFADQPYFPKV